MPDFGSFVAELGFGSMVVELECYGMVVVQFDGNRRLHLFVAELQSRQVNEELKTEKKRKKKTQKRRKR